MRLSFPTLLMALLLAMPVTVLRAQEVPASEPMPGAEAPVPAAPDAAPIPEADTSLDGDVQTLKQQVLDLNRDLFVLEEELLFPANTQVAVFISVDVGTFFRLDSVTLKVDDKEVANYLYTEREKNALLKGGVQQLYRGNLKVGEHEIVAVFKGEGPSNRDYTRGATFRLDKGVGAKFLELKVTDSEQNLQPHFAVKAWE